MRDAWFEWVQNTMVVWCCAKVTAGDRRENLGVSRKYLLSETHRLVLGVMSLTPAGGSRCRVWAC